MSTGRDSNTNRQPATDCTNASSDTSVPSDAQRATPQYTTNPQESGPPSQEPSEAMYMDDDMTGPLPKAEYDFFIGLIQSRRAEDHVPGFNPSSLLWQPDNGDRSVAGVETDVREAGRPGPSTAAVYDTAASTNAQPSTQQRSPPRVPTARIPTQPSPLHQRARLLSSEAQVPPTSAGTSPVPASVPASTSEAEVQQHSDLSSPSNVYDSRHSRQHERPPSRQSE